MQSYKKNRIIYLKFHNIIVDLLYTQDIRVNIDMTSTLTVDPHLTMKMKVYN